MPGSPIGTGMRSPGNPLRKLLKQGDVLPAEFGIFGHPPSYKTWFLLVLFSFSTTARQLHDNHSRI
jgi:hypothetical protein